METELKSAVVMSTFTKPPCHIIPLLQMGCPRFDECIISVDDESGPVFLYVAIPEVITSSTRVRLTLLREREGERESEMPQYASMHLLLSSHLLPCQQVLLSCHVNKRFPSDTAGEHFAVQQTADHERGLQLILSVHV